MSSIDNFHQTQIYHIAPDATQTHTEKTGESSGQREKKNHWQLHVKEHLKNFN